MAGSSELRQRRRRVMQEIDEIFERLDGSVRSVSGDEWAVRLPFYDEEAEGWTVLDALVHITAWKANGISVAHRLREVDLPDNYPAALLGIDIPSFNSELLKSRPQPDLAIDEHHQIHRDFLEAVDALPDSRVLNAQGGPRRWLAPALEHSHHHLLHIEQALGKGGMQGPGVES